MRSYLRAMIRRRDSEQADESRHTCFYEGLRAGRAGRDHDRVSIFEPWAMVARGPKNPPTGQVESRADRALRVRVARRRTTGAYLPIADLLSVADPCRAVTGTPHPEICVMAAQAAERPEPHPHTPRPGRDPGHGSSPTNAGPRSATPRPCLS